MAYPDWLDPFLTDSPARLPAMHLRVEGLALSVSCAEPAILTLVRHCLRPLDLSGDAPRIRALSLRIEYDDTLSGRVVEAVEDGTLRAVPLKAATHHDTRSIALDGGRVLCYRPWEGLVWIVDRARGTVRLLVSSKTEWPAHEAVATVQAIIVGFLHHMGWHTFHAGAVCRAGAVRLVVGASGAGKTSLILALASAGADFIANERVLLKASGEGVRLLPFPMGIGIGYGTARQYPALLRLFRNSALLGAPQYPFDRDRIDALPVEDQWRMKEKIYLSAPELAAAMGGGGMHPGGMVEQVLMPNLTRDRRPAVTAIPAPEAAGILWSNRIRPSSERHFPAWLPLGFNPSTETDAERAVTRLLDRPLSRVDFFAGEDVAALQV